MHGVNKYGWALAETAKVQGKEAKSALAGSLTAAPNIFAAATEAMVRGGIAAAMGEATNANLCLAVESMAESSLCRTMFNATNDIADKAIVERGAELFGSKDNCDGLAGAVKAACDAIDPIGIGHSRDSMVQSSAYYETTRRMSVDGSGPIPEPSPSVKQASTQFRQTMEGGTLLNALVSFNQELVSVTSSASAGTFGHMLGSMSVALEKVIARCGTMDYGEIVPALGEFTKSVTDFDNAMYAKIRGE